jgi:heterodisulfide reductase subunit C
MDNIDLANANVKRFLKELQRLSGQRIHMCMECGLCSALCPARISLRSSLRQVLHRVKMGRKVDWSNAEIVWRCMSCRFCEARCPRRLDLAKVHATLRFMLLEETMECGLRPEDFSSTDVEEGPQILLVAALREHTS